MSHLDLYGGESGHVDRATLRAIIDRHGGATFLDVGCGPGSMVTTAVELGLSAYGIDGHAPFASATPPIILYHDLEASAYQAGPVDIVWCHEVAEHLDSYRIGYLLHTFAAGRVLMLSAATPGIGGIHHVNEQAPAYWRRLMVANGWTFDDGLTAQIREVGESWFIRHHGQVFTR
jgi:Methyltransferase domain